MSAEQQSAPRTFRSLALEHEFVEWVMRKMLSDLVSDGAAPKEVLHSAYLSRMESEVTQDSLRERLEQMQAWEASLRGQLERYHWVETPQLKPPFLESKKSENQENDGQQEKEPRRRRRRKKVSKDPSGSPDRGSE